MDEKDSESKPLSQDFAQSSVEEDSPPLRRCPTAVSHISINADLADASGKLKKKKKNQTKTCSKLTRVPLTRIKLHILEIDQLDILWYVVSYYSQLVVVLMMQS